MPATHRGRIVGHWSEICACRMIEDVDVPKDEHTVRAGEAIRKARLAKGWTQDQFVDRLKESMQAPAGEEKTAGQSAISRWEGGVHAPEYWRWRAIEDVLDMEHGTLARLLLDIPIPATVEARLDAIERTLAELRQMFSAGGLVRQGPDT